MRGRVAVALAAVALGLALIAPEAASAAPMKQAGAPVGGREEQGPAIDAKAWALIDARTGEVVAAHDGGQHLLIASTTKLMTAYVTLHEAPLNKIVRAAPYDPEFGESLMGLRTGQRISIRDLLYGLILRSGNDAAHTLAVRIAGSQARFVAEMNRYAAALGLANTHYANPVGLDQKGNYSSALDQTTLTRRLLAIPAFARIADSRSARLRSVHPERRIETINELLLMAPWVTGVKTGHTWKAGYVLVGSGRKKGVELISAAIDAPTDEARFDDNLDLLEYGFSLYRKRRVVRAGKDLAEPSIRYSGGRLPLRAARGLTIGLRRGQRLQLQLHVPGEVEGPIHSGARLGTATAYVDGMRAGSVALLAGRAVPKASVFDRLRGFIGDNLIPIAIVVFVILMGAALLYRRSTRRNHRGRRIG
jgi:D-alanyl-D-alanine carboxypeptidase (penicillin-binding protein 5/6)